MPGMARARAGRDDRGRLCVFGRALVRGVERRRRIVVPGDDEALAGETVRELNRRFALGDLSWFAQGREGARPPPRVLMLADWSARWLEQLEGQVTAHTFKDYRSHVRDILRRFGERRLDRITPGDVLILRDAIERSATGLAFFGCSIEMRGSLGTSIRALWTSRFPAAAPSGSGGSCARSESLSDRWRRQSFGAWLLFFSTRRTTASAGTSLLRSSCS